MKILVLSDLHIGNGNSLGAFGWRDDDFISRLELYRELYGIDTVVLNGDVFEMYKYSFKEIYRHHRKLLDYFFREEFILLRGNHDSAFPGSRDELTVVNSSGRLIHFEHGHRADFCGYMAVRAFHRIGFRLLRFSSLLGSIHRLARFFTERYENFDRIQLKKGRYRRYAEGLLKGLDDVIVLGHTHAMESIEFHERGGTKMMINSGTCSQGRFQAVVLDTESLEYLFIRDGKRKTSLPLPFGKSRELQAVG
ncbi:MAG: metallophosphoesterase family protein [Spirochaetales bacterium]|nr:metallophosphoesterase family protein [Spirochaetales bacterium]